VSMDRYRLIPIIVLLSSLLILAILFFIRISSGGAPASPKPIPTETPEVVEEVTPSPTFTETPQPTETEVLEPTATIYVPTFTLDPSDPANAPPAGCNVAGFITDVTVIDNTKVDRGLSFTKTWRLQNDGTCTWTPNYKVYFHSGDQMEGLDSQPLTNIDIPPGTTVDVSVNMVAPKKPGKYKGYWSLMDANGFKFGISSAGNAFYVQIVVP
jgi:hypothetical protein